MLILNLRRDKELIKIKTKEGDIVIKVVDKSSSKVGIICNEKIEIRRIDPSGKELGEKKDN